LATPNPRKLRNSKGENRAIQRAARKADANLATDLAAELGEHVTVREDGRARRVSKQRALIKSLMSKALGGDVRATTAFLALYARTITDIPEDHEDPLEQDELDILRRFAPRLLKSVQKKRKE
jgi:hypothetical protein